MDTGETIPTNKELDDGRIMMSRHELSSGVNSLLRPALRYLKSRIYIGVKVRVIPR